LTVKRSTASDAICRRAQCFVGRPEAVVAGVARAVKKGGVFVVQDYFNYEGVRITPNCEIFQRVFSMVARSWRRRGGNPDIGAEIPGILARCGFAVKETGRLCAPPGRFAAVAMAGDVLCQLPSHSGELG